MSREAATAADARWMRAALALGRRGLGHAAPNPSVGALVVRDGAVLGRGVTAPGGRPHAEPIALAEAGHAARGATLYVTLEPCSHHGRTPPCVDAILDAGIARVVFALGDPDPRVAGRGLDRLRAAGIAVVGPVGENEAARDHRGHVMRVTAGRPAVTVKMAETADGYAAHAAGPERLMITGPAANRLVHRLRAAHDAVMVGSGTALADDPQLTVRLPGVHRQPMRVVLDARLRLSETATLVRTARQAPALILTAAGRERWTPFEAQGAEVLPVAPSAGGLDLAKALAALGRRGLTRILCEGGPMLASALIVGNWADSVCLITSTKALGGPGLPSLTPQARMQLEDGARFSLVDEVGLGSDRLRFFERTSFSCSPD